MWTFLLTLLLYSPAHCWYIGAAKVEPAPLMVAAPEPLPPLEPPELLHAAASSAIPSAPATAAVRPARRCLDLLTSPPVLAGLVMNPLRGCMARTAGAIPCRADSVGR